MIVMRKDKVNLFFGADTQEHHTMYAVLRGNLNNHVCGTDLHGPCITSMDRSWIR